MSFRPSAHQSFIPIAFFSAKIEIAMGNGKGATWITADIDLRHAHGVNAAANCQKGLIRIHYFLLAIVQVKPNRRDSLNCTLCFV